MMPCPECYEPEPPYTGRSIWREPRWCEECRNSPDGVDETAYFLKKLKELRAEIDNLKNKVYTLQKINYKP